MKKMKEINILKLIVVGDGAVGKTAITIRFATGAFQEDYKMTMGVNFSLKTIELNNHIIRFQIWDTGGQEKFNKMRPLYFKGAKGAVVVFDVTNKLSFMHLNEWVKAVLDNCGKIPLVIAGNKIDLEEQRQVSTEEGKQVAEQLARTLGYAEIPYFETSAKTGDRVDQLFRKMGELIIFDSKNKAEKSEL